MKTGWYFNIGVKEYFIESNQQNKTRKFIEKILSAMKVPITDLNISFIQNRMVKAKLKIKYCPACVELGIKDHYYYSIFGDNFSGCGSEDINDGFTIILKIA